jgi:cytidylate kinase
MAMPSSCRAGGAHGDVIAIDGPAASGKSTIARALAAELGCLLLNSGDFYRAVALSCVRNQIDCEDAEAVAAFAGRLELAIECCHSECRPRMNFEFAPTDLRSGEVNERVAVVAAIPAVRNAITSLIRGFAAGRRIVVEGRDIGTVVFPETPHKFFLDAHPAVRQKRRAHQGQRDNVAERDTYDTNRAAAPLKACATAKVIDTSDLSTSEVLAKLMEDLDSGSLKTSRSPKAIAT